jgi:O-antigen ligase
MRYRAAILLIGAVGITPTFSRSGFLYVGLLLIGSIATKLLNRVQTALVLIAVPALLAATVFSYDFLMSSSDDANLHNVVRRLEWFRGVGEEDGAIEGRKIGAQQAWQLFLEYPITGRGLGATGLESAGMEGPHNMYLMLMGEQGFIGLFLYVGLISVVIVQGRRLVKTAIDKEGQEVGHALLLYAAFLFAYGFFSHNVLEEAQSIFILSFIAAAASAAPRAALRAQTRLSDFHRPEGVRDARPRLDHS